MGEAAKHIVEAVAKLSEEERREVFELLLEQNVANQQGDRYLMADDGLTDEERQEISKASDKSFEDEAAGRVKSLSEVLDRLKAL